MTKKNKNSNMDLKEPNASIVEVKDVKLTNRVVLAVKLVKPMECLATLSKNEKKIWYKVFRLVVEKFSVFTN